jgi:hypothetical protein
MRIRILRSWLAALTCAGLLPLAAVADEFTAPRTREDLAAFETQAERELATGARPRSVDAARWLFDLYSGHHREHTPEWEWNPLFDQVRPDEARAQQLRARIQEACQQTSTLGCGGEFIFGYVERSGMFHIRLLPDERPPETDPRFLIEFPRGRATFKIIDLRPYGTRMPSFAEMDRAPSLRRAGFLCRVQSAERRDPVEPRLVSMVKMLAAEYRRARKAAPDFAVQCSTAESGFFPVFSGSGYDLQLLGGHISPRGSRVQFENPVLLITPTALLMSARLDRSRMRGDAASD